MLEWRPSISEGGLEWSLDFCRLVLHMVLGLDAICTFQELDGRVLVLQAKYTLTPHPKPHKPLQPWISVRSG